MSATRNRRLSRSNSKKKVNGEEFNEVYTVLQYAPQPDELFTMIIYDIDHPNAPYAHSIITNIPGEEVNQGDVLLPHLEIPHGDPHHRYVVDVYRQVGRSIIHFMLDDTNRPYFDVDGFVRQNRLVLVARQTIGNIFGVGVALLLGGLVLGGIAGYGIAASREKHM